MSIHRIKRAPLRPKHPLWAPNYDDDDASNEDVQNGYDNGRDYDTEEIENNIDKMIDTDGNANENEPNLHDQTNPTPQADIVQPMAKYAMSGEMMNQRIDKITRKGENDDISYYPF